MNKRKKKKSKCESCREELLGSKGLDELHQTESDIHFSSLQLKVQMNS